MTDDRAPTVMAAGERKGTRCTRCGAGRLNTTTCRML
jgi:hypothetical protein